jgi:hypothetical protein
MNKLIILILCLISLGVNSAETPANEKAIMHTTCSLYNDLLGNNSIAKVHKKMALKTITLTRFKAIYDVNNKYINLITKGQGDINRFNSIIIPFVTGQGTCIRLMNENI